jgi:8-oxo-dGTP diphosphatase
VPEDDPFGNARAFGAAIFGVPKDRVVRAAGAIPLRTTEKGVEVGLIHRPAYDDWSFPKGKLEEGEDFAAAALRELREEVASGTALGRPLGCTAYIDPRGRPKVACYYLVGSENSVFKPSREVDRFEWLPREAAEARLSSPGDRLLLRAARL